MSDREPEQPGDVLLLSQDSAHAGAGLYVLLDRCSFAAVLCRLGEEPDTQDLVATDVVLTIPAGELDRFEPTGLSIEIDDVSYAPLTVRPGDILEPGEPIDGFPFGLYQVLRTNQAEVLLCRVHKNEDGKPGTAGRGTWIGRDSLGSFRVRPTDDLWQEAT
jgi:hypothetical protein